MITNLRFFSALNAGFKTARKSTLVLFFPVLMTAVFQVKRSSQLIFRIVIILFLMGLSFICTSCKSDSLENDPFYRLYSPVSIDAASSPASSASSSSSSLTLSASGVPLSLFSRILSDTFSVGIVFSLSLSEKKIFAEFKDTSFSDVLNVISRQLDSEIIQVGNTFYIGKLRPEDRAILVRKVLGFSNSDLARACQGVLGDKGKVQVIGSGVVSATDSASVIQRLSELLDYLSSLSEPVWIVQLAFLTLNRDILLEGGLKVSTSGTVSYDIGNNSIEAKDFKIDGILNAAASSSFADVHSSPMLLCREGTVSQWKSGKRVPIPRRSISQYGTVTTTGYDYIDTGFNVEARISRSKLGAILSLSIGKSDIDSYVDYAPVTSQTFYSFTADLAPLRPYLLGEIQTFTDLNKSTDILNFGKTKGKHVVQVWGQIYCISPGVHRPVPGPASGAGTAVEPEPAR